MAHIFDLYTWGKERQDLMFQFKGLLAVTDEPGYEGILMCSQSFQKSAVPNVALAEKWVEIPSTLYPAWKAVNDYNDVLNASEANAFSHWYRLYSLIPLPC